MSIKKVAFLYLFFPITNLAIASNSQLEISDLSVEKVQCVSPANQDIVARFLVDYQNNKAYYADSQWHRTDPILGKSDFDCELYGTDKSKISFNCVMKKIPLFTWELNVIPYEQLSYYHSTYSSNYCPWECTKTTYYCFNLKP